MFSFAKFSPTVRLPQALRAAVRNWQDSSSLVWLARRAIAAILTRRAGQLKLQPFSKGSRMRHLLTIIALGATSHFAGAAPIAAGWRVPSSWERSAGVLLAGMGGGAVPRGGMNCGANCGGGGMGGGGSGRGSSGGMGGAGGGMGGGAEGFGPLLGVPWTNCPDHRHKADRRHPAQNSEAEFGSTQCPENR